MAILYKGAATTFRIVGLASANHHLFTIWNNTGSGLIVDVRDLSFQTDHTALSTAIAPIVQCARITAAPTGGNDVAKVARDTNFNSPSANVVLKGATASDGGAAAAITVGTLGARMWADFKSRMHSAVGQILFPDEYLIPPMAEADPIVLRAGEGLAITVIQAALVTDHYIVSCAWDERDS